MSRDDLNGDVIRTIRNAWINMRDVCEREGLTKTAKQAQRRIDMMTDRYCLKTWG